MTRSNNSVWCMWLLMMAAVGEQSPMVGGIAREQSPVVATQQGLVTGLQEQSTKGHLFHSYYAIPYAQPPVGPLRFKTPVEAEGWDGVRAGMEQPIPCLQVNVASVMAGRPSILGDEDCLYLNVFTPKPGEGDKGLPVLVFIHGGAYFGGSANRYQPYGLLNHDIVLVTLQYRLGILGFLSTEDEALPGNLALHDQLAALRWVAANIRAFGGDPASVTLSGHSAGSSAVQLLLLSPSSKGLIHRAILQSGSALCPRSMGSSHRLMAHHLAAQLGCKENQLASSHQLVECLRGVEAEQLVAKITSYMKWEILPMTVGPRVDGDVLPAAPEILARLGTHGDVPIISGTTTHEGGQFALPLYEREALRSALIDHFPELGPVALDFRLGDTDPHLLATKVFNYYLGGVNLQDENADGVAQIFTDRHFRVCQDVSALLHARAAPGRTFSYTFGYRGQHSLADYFNTSVGRHWVTHGDEMFYLYPGNNIWRPLTSSPDLALRDIFTSLWTNFAATGNPTPDSSLGFLWEATTGTRLHHLALSPSPIMVHEAGRYVQTWEFWTSLPTVRNKLLQRNNWDLTECLSPGSSP